MFFYMYFLICTHLVLSVSKSIKNLPFRLCIGSHKFKVVTPSWWIRPFNIISCPSLLPVMLSTLSDMTIVWHNKHSLHLCVLSFVHLFTFNPFPYILGMFLVNRLPWWLGLQHGRSLYWDDFLEKGKATHPSILAWRIPWTIQVIKSQRVGHNWVPGLPW